MWEVWILGSALFLCIGLAATSVILTATRKHESPLDKIFARQEKIDALVMSADLWLQIGSPHEAVACIDEAKRLNAEVIEILQGETL